MLESANRPAKPKPRADTDHGFDDKLWSLIEECWYQEPSNRPTAAIISLRLIDKNGWLAEPAEIYKKEIANLAEELARVKERNNAAKEELDKELAELRKSLAGQKREQAELKKNLDEERDLRKRLEENLSGYEDDVVIA